MAVTEKKDIHHVLFRYLIYVLQKLFCYLRSSKLLRKEEKTNVQKIYQTIETLIFVSIANLFISGYHKRELEINKLLLAKEITFKNLSNNNNKIKWSLE